MLEYGKSQLGTETHLFIYVQRKVIKHWTGAWSAWAISFSAEPPNSAGWLRFTKFTEHGLSKKLGLDNFQRSLPTHMIP